MVIWYLWDFFTVTVWVGKLSVKEEIKSSTTGVIFLEINFVCLILYALFKI